MNESNDWHFKLKKITISNWQQLDETSQGWLQSTAFEKTNDDWVKYFLCPKLDPKIPSEIAKLFEVARGAMIYSWQFYPLATLGAEQCFHILETGTKIRCEQLGITKNKNFDESIKALSKHGVILDADQSRWESVRMLRNSASHPKRQSIFDPGQAQWILVLTADFLNDIFK